MARKMTEWPSKRGPITKIMPSDGCIGDTVPLAVGKWYDFHEFGWYMGNVGLIDVPNTLSTKAKGDVVDYDALQEEIDEALYQVNDQKLSRHAYQVAFLIGLILPVYENKRRPDAKTLEHIQRLAFVARDISRRLGGTRFDHVSELCETLIGVADSIEQTYCRPNPRDLKLIKSLSDAILAGFHPNREVAAMAVEISKSINKFRLK